MAFDIDVLKSEALRKIANAIDGSSNNNKNSQIDGKEIVLFANEIKESKSLSFEDKLEAYKLLEAQSKQAEKSRKNAEAKRCKKSSEDNRTFKQKAKDVATDIVTGARNGFVDTIADTAQMPCFIPLTLITAPIGGIIGAIEGAYNGITEPKKRMGSIIVTQTQTVFSSEETAFESLKEKWGFSKM